MMDENFSNDTKKTSIYTFFKKITPPNKIIYQNFSEYNKILSIHQNKNKHLTKKLICLVRQKIRMPTIFYDQRFGWVNSEYSKRDKSMQYRFSRTKKPNSYGNYNIS